MRISYIVLIGIICLLIGAIISVPYLASIIQVNTTNNKQVYNTSMPTISIRPISTINPTSSPIPTPTITPTTKPKSTRTPTVSTPQPTKAPNINIEVSVINKYTNSEPMFSGSFVYDYYVVLDYEIINRTNKTIRGVEGIVDVKDMFGKHIDYYSGDITGIELEPNYSVEITGKMYKINEFIQRHQKVYATEFRDLIFDYKITQVVFTDGTIYKP